MHLKSKKAQGSTSCHETLSSCDPGCPLLGLLDGASSLCREDPFWNLSIEDAVSQSPACIR